MTKNEQKLLAMYRELYDALSDLVEDPDIFPRARSAQLFSIMTDGLGNEVRRLEALVAKEKHI